MESKNDSVMLTLGVVILLIALMGSAMFEADEASGGSSLFNVFYTENSMGVFGTTGNTNEGESETIPVDIADPANIVTLEFILTWTDNDASEINPGGLGPVQNQPDTFRLTVAMPDGTEHSEEAANDIETKDGIILINFTFQSFPEDDLGIPSQSNFTLEQELTTEYGFGNWTVTVTCEEAGDSETTTGQTVDQDDGNDWDLDVVATCYTMVIKKAEIPTE